MKIKYVRTYLGALSLGKLIKQIWMCAARWKLNHISFLLDLESINYHFQVSTTYNKSYSK